MFRPRLQTHSTQNAPTNRPGRFALHTAQRKRGGAATCLAALAASAAPEAALAAPAGTACTATFRMGGAGRPAGGRVAAALTFPPQVAAGPLTTAAAALTTLAALAFWPACTSWLLAPTGPGRPAGRAFRALDGRPA